MNDYKNPPNPYHEAKFEAWRRYTKAYHSNATFRTQQRLFKAYTLARMGYNDNPQTIFN